MQNVLMHLWKYFLSEPHYPYMDMQIMHVKKCLCQNESKL